MPFRSSSSHVGGWSSSSLWTDSSIVLDKPAGVADGDLLVAAIYWSLQGTIGTIPSGWVLRAARDTSFYRFSVFTKVASTEPANWTWSDASGVMFMGAVCAYNTSLNTFVAQRQTALGTISNGTPAQTQTIASIAANSTKTLTVMVSAGENVTPVNVSTHNANGSSPGSVITAPLANERVAIKGNGDLDVASAPVTQELDWFDGFTLSMADLVTTAATIPAQDFTDTLLGSYVDGDVPPDAGSSTKWRGCQLRFDIVESVTASGELDLRLLKIQLPELPYQVHKAMLRMGRDPLDGTD